MATNSQVSKGLPVVAIFMSIVGLGWRVGTEAGRGLTTALAVLAATWGASPIACPPCAPTLECHSGTATLRAETGFPYGLLLAGVLLFSAGLVVGAGAFWFCLYRKLVEGTPVAEIAARGKGGKGGGVWLTHAAITR